jgi:hypothetical protein
MALREHPMYVGPLRPKLLLVGERPNEKANAVFHEAPFLPYPATSAQYLLDNVLLPEWFTAAHIGLTNAYGHGDEELDLHDLYSRLWCPRTVALGKVADQQLTAHDVPHSAVPHPQYIRRFLYSSAGEYRRAILRCQ